MKISRKSIVNHSRDLVNFVIDMLFCVIILQGVGAPGNFSNMIGSASKAWYGINKFAPVILFFVLLFVTRFRILRRDAFVVLFCVYILVTGLTISGFSTVAFEQSYKLVLTICVSLLMVKIRDKHSIALLFAISQIIVVLMILAMIVTHEDSVSVSDGYYDFNLVGLHTTKNSCAYQMVFGATLFYYLFRNTETKVGKIFWLALIAVELYLIFLARTMGAYLGGLIPALIYEFMIRRKRRINFAKIFIVVNAVFWTVIMLVLPSIAFILEKLGKSVTLTGRTYIWSSIIGYVSGYHILFGYGYGGFWNTANTGGLYRIYAQYGLTEEIVGGHNLFIELYINIGLIGITLFLLALFSMLRPAKYTPAKYLGLEAMFLTFYLLRSLVERTLNATTYDTIVLFVFSGMIYYSYRSYKQSVNKLERKAE